MGFGDIQAADKALYIMCQGLVRLGYFSNLRKYVLKPTIFLGTICASKALAFRLPEDKKIYVCALVILDD